MPRVVDHEQKREALLAHSERLFADHGYDGLSMRKLARELGVSTGTFYHYFPSKEALFDALLARAVVRDVAAVTGDLPEEATTAERLARLVQYLSSPAGVAPRNTLLLALDMRRSRDDASTTALLQHTLSAYQAAIQQELRADDEVAEDVLTVVLGVLVRTALQEGWDFQPTLERSVLRSTTAPG